MGSEICPPMFRWPARYLPTSPLRLANPLGKAESRERRSRCGDQTKPPASTKVFPSMVTSSPPASVRLPVARTMRPVLGSATRRRTSVSVTRVIFFVASSASHVKSGEYFAPDGQTG